MSIQNNGYDNKTRANLAYALTGFVIVSLSYIIVRFGDRVEILTLIIGIIGGTILGAVLGTYFAASNNNKISHPDGSTTAEITATITKNEDESTKE